VQTKMVEFWDDSKDIKLAIVKKLGQLERREDLVGWVRPHQEANLPALSDEIARLSKENAELRSQIGSKSEVIINGLPYSQLKTLLQRKELWDFVRTQKQMIRGGFDRRQVPEADGLAELGLMRQREPGYEVYVPTEAGRMLLNKIEFEDLPPSATVRPK
jgi:hypothetical protein